ncbi:hypothetical protein AGIG_G13589 [Arapaima gigas]
MRICQRAGESKLILKTSESLVSGRGAGQAEGDKIPQQMGKHLHSPGPDSRYCGACNQARAVLGKRRGSDAEREVKSSAT